MLEKIEVGKTYRNSNGKIVELVHRDVKQFCAKIVETGEYYINGVNWLEDWREIKKKNLRS